MDITAQLDREQLIQMAKGTGRGLGLDPVLVCAVCEQESAWDPYAVRFEPKFLSRYIHPALPTAPTTHELTLAMSFGLMQVMGEVAVEFGFTGTSMLKLTDPSTNLLYGCRKLRRCMTDKLASVPDALLAYNGGSNPLYPGQVLTRMPKYQ